MASGKNWYGLAIGLLIISMLHLAFVDYDKSVYYALLEGIWALGCLIMGVRAELLQKNK
ncbi:MAG TPA: hypothetical protein VGB22_01280 [candidate division Zixibacteria bacterium]